jgi:hypothetical protein
MEISSPRELIAAIPHLLGFNPDDSLVVVALDENQVHSAVRVDWPVSQAVLEGSLTRYAEGLDGQDLVLAFYTDSDVKDYFDIERIFSHCEKLDVLLIHADRWKSLMCDDVECCPAEGREISRDTALLDAEFVFGGSSPFASRDDLVAVLAPQVLSLSEREECLTAFGSLRDISEHQTEVDWIGKLFVHHQIASWPEIARACQALSDIRVRDALLRMAFDSINVRIDTREWLLHNICRIPDNYIPGAATLLAGVVWLDGNGALARIALDRALEADAEYSLAQLLDTALTHAVPSRIWTESLEAVSYEDCLRGAA